MTVLISSNLALSSLRDASQHAAPFIELLDSHIHTPYLVIELHDRAPFSLFNATQKIPTPFLHSGFAGNAAQATPNCAPYTTF
jgi:hypothetical protein